MLDKWRRNIVVPLNKNKGDMQCCTNYHGIKLSHYETMGKRNGDLWKNSQRRGKILFMVYNDLARETAQ